MPSRAMSWLGFTLSASKVPAAPRSSTGVGSSSMMWRGSSRERSTRNTRPRRSSSQLANKTRMRSGSTNGVGNIAWLRMSGVPGGASTRPSFDQSAVTAPKSEAIEIVADGPRSEPFLELGKATIERAPLILVRVAEIEIAGLPLECREGRCEQEVERSGVARPFIRRDILCVNDLSGAVEEGSRTDPFSLQDSEQADIVGHRACNRRISARL